MVYGKSASEQAIQSNDKVLGTNVSNLSADKSIAQGEQRDEKFDVLESSDNDVSKFGVSLCNESTLNSKLDNFVSGGIVYFDKAEINNNVLASVSMSDSNVSTPSTSASKSCDHS